MDTNLYKQRLDIDAVAAALQSMIDKLAEEKNILLAAFAAIDKDQLNIAEDRSILAQEARKIMKKYTS